MKLHLEIWRPAGPTQDGAFEPLDVDRYSKIVDDSLTEVDTLAVLAEITVNKILMDKFAQPRINESGNKPFASA